MSTPENQVPEMPSSTKLISTLAVVAMISGLLVVLVYEFTKPIIAENQRLATERAIFKVLPKAVSRLTFVVENDKLTPADDKTVGELLLEPTRIYVKSLLALIESVSVHALAHITGGGITENLPRVLPKGLSASIDLNSWSQPVVFQWLKQQGKLEESEMLKTFNCGIGMMICVPQEQELQAKEVLMSQGETVYSVGEIIASSDHDRVLYSD